MPSQLRHPDKARKIRVLVLSALIPIEKSGAGCLTMQRHFLLRDDFTVAVAAARDFSIDGVPCFRIRLDRLTERLRRTRFSRFVINCDYVRNWLLLPSRLEKFAKDFQPDVIFSVVDDWHMGIAWRLSRRLGVPLAVDFQDLFALSEFESEQVRPFGMVRSVLVDRYRFLNRKAEQVFHVGPGMKEWFRPEERGDLLYPLALQSLSALSGIEQDAEVKWPIRLVYAGNSAGAYGTMLLRLARELMGNPRIKFEFYSSAAGMPPEDLRWLRENEFYKGYLPPAELADIQQKADALLLVMSFEDEWRTFMETSFNTKWSDYLALGKPIFVWAPSYSSAARFAVDSGAAHPVISADPKALVGDLVRIMECPELRKSLVRRAREAGSTVLDPNNVQRVLCESLLRLTCPVTP